MSDLISRQAAIDTVMKVIREGYKWQSSVSEKICLLNAVYCALEDIPSAQPTVDAVPVEYLKRRPSAEPVRHGKWLWLDGVRCSECNYKLATTGLPSYCPNCGCRMDKERK